MPKKTTISVIKCDVSSLAGNHIAPKPLLNIGEKRLRKGQEKGLINSYYVFHAGDDLELLMVHEKGEKPGNSQAGMGYIPRSQQKSGKPQTLWRWTRPSKNSV